MKPEMFCITIATNMILATSSPDSVKNEYSGSDALSRSSDSFWDETD